MNETSITASDTGSGSVVDRVGFCGIQAAGMRPLHGHHARVGAEGLRQLSAPHVESIDAARAASQQHVREAARGRTDVQRHPAGRIDAEGIERSDELVTAARDVGAALGGRELRAGIDQVAGLAVEARAVALADADPAAEQQRLGAGAGLGDAALDQQLVEPDAGWTAGRPVRPVRRFGRRTRPARPRGPAAGRARRASRGAAPRCRARPAGWCGAGR